jgi:tetratricopeptide (TPR) repeat protein
LNNATSDPLIGRAISQYEIVARIGGGGMGVVYKAADTKLGRTVALKFLPPQWSHDEGAKQRFLREAQAASATNHRNICIIHDISETDDGQLFIVMACYEGQTLKQKLEGGPLPVADALEIATEAAEGLAKAHSQGVVHRDVKPGNLMVTEDGVKVLDFGLAKFADSLQLTMPGSTVGTVAYMSPEQARGEEADARSDVWALGVVLYEMLSGRVPFAGAYPEAIFHAIKNEPVPLLTDNRQIPTALQSLVFRALEKDPERRYQSARELARDLRLLQGRTVPVDLRTETLPMIPLPGAPRRLSRKARVLRAATPARVVAGVAVAAVVAAGVYWWLARPIVRVPIAIAPVANHTGEPELDGYRLALTAMLVDELAESPNVRVVPYPRLLEIVRRFIGAGDVSSTEAIQAIATHSGAAFVVVPSLEYTNGMWFAQAQFRNSADGTATVSYQTETLTSSLPKDTALRLLTGLADGVQEHFRDNGPGRDFSPRPASARFRILDAAGAFEEGMSMYERLEYSSALAAFERAASLDDQHAMTQAWISRMLTLLSRRNDAVAAALEARRLVTSDTPDRDTVFIEAVLAESQGDATAAEQRYRQLAADRADDVEAQIDLADFLKRKSPDQAAITAYRDVLRLDEGYSRVHVDLCQLYVRQIDYTLAEQEARAAIEKFQRLGHREGEAQALLCLGDAQRAQGGEARLTEARRNIGSARAIFEAQGSEYGLSRVYQYFGNVAYDERNYSEAAGFFEQALTRSRAVGNRLIEGNALMNLGVTSEFLGHRSRVLEYYDQARLFYERNGDAPRAAEQEANAAALLIDYGTDPKSALRRLLNARATFQKLGNVEFEAITIEMEGAAALHAGRHDEARRNLRTALSLAKERQRGNRVVFVTLRLAESYFATAEYETARDILEQIAATPVGQGEPAVPIALGRIFVRLGDLDGARRRLEEMLATVERSGQLWLAPLALTALGELELETGNEQQARVLFGRAADFWSDHLPHAASVEARCYGAVLDALERDMETHPGIAASIEQARGMGRLSTEALCRIQQARLDLTRGRSAEALAGLGEIPLGGAHTVGKELEAFIHYWRSRALAARGDADRADSEAATARGLVLEIQASLPSLYQGTFVARPDIRRIVQWNPRVTQR